MAQSDRRVKYTKRVLKEAVLELLQTKSIDSLTIKEICELADVNRGTFYLHYSQPRDILKEIENSFLEENMILFDDYWKENDVNTMKKIFECIVENKAICRVIMGENGDPQFIRSIVNLCREGVVDGWKKEFPQYKKEHLDFLFDFVFTGSMQLILNWIDDDQGISPEAFCQRMDRLGHYSLVAVGDFSDVVV